MNISDKEKAELKKWNRMKSRGKKTYILQEGFLNWGLPMGIGWGFIFQLFEESFKFDGLIHQSLLRRLLIGVVLFSICGYFQSLLTWRKYKKKYSKNN